MTTNNFRVRNGLTIGGATSGSTSFNNSATGSDIAYTLPTASAASDGYVLSSTTAGVLSWVANPDTNTTYTYTASSTTGGSNLNLVGSDSTTNTIKLTNGTGVTNTYVSPTEVSINIGQDVATTANPIFAGGTFGNVTVGVLSDQTISVTSGDLILSAGSSNIVSINNTNTGNPTYITRNTATTNGVVRSLALRTVQSAQPVVGFANQLEFQQDTAVGTTKRSGYIQVAPTNLTVGSESFRMDFGLMNANATAANKLSLFSNGDLNMAAGGKFGILGATNGYTLLQAPTTGNNITYTLPGADGTSGYVLSTNGSGTLSWVSRPDTNTTYTIDASTTTGGANFNLTGSDSSVDTIKYANGTGITAVATDASTITLTNTGVTSLTTSSGLSTNTSATGAVSVTNTGVTSNVAGTGIGVSAATGAVTITNTGVTSAVAGTGIGVSGSTGAVTFSNTGVTSAVAGTGVTVSASTGAVTFSIGQSVATTASPTFAAGSFSSLILRGSTSGTNTISSPAVAGTVAYTLPTGYPAASGYVLSSTTGGTMSWVAQSGGGASATDFTPSFLLGGM